MFHLFLSSQRVFAAFLFVAMSGVAVQAHSFGEGSSDLTPPMALEAKELEEAKSEFGSGVSALRGVYDQLKLWNAGTKLQICFYDGDEALQAFFVKTVSKWLIGTSLTADFGPVAHFRVCSADPPLSDIRISFSKKGSWSYIGTDSLLPDVINGPSLNVETKGLPFNRINQSWLEETSLHEFGHALGLLHEHQSPKSNCGNEFDWPKIYAYTKKSWNWDADKVNTNFQSYVLGPRLRTTPYDPLSIMHYALPEWMFKNGAKASCFVKQPKTISKLDEVTILESYPANVASQSAHLAKIAAAAGPVMAELNLDSAKLARAGQSIATVVKHFTTPVTLRFALAGDSVIRGSDDETELRPCNESQSGAVASTPGIRCDVSPDASSLVIEILPTVH